MDVFKVILILGVLLIVVYYMNLGPALQHFFYYMLAGIPTFSDGITLGKILDVTIRLAFLAIIFQFVRMLMGKG